MGIPIIEQPTATARVRSVLAIITLRSPFWQRSGKHRFGRLLAHLLFAYLAILVVVLLLENWLLFRASTASEGWVPPPEGCTPEEVWLTLGEGQPIHAWWIKPPKWEPEQGALLLCHGNGGNLSYRGKYASYWVREQQLAVLLFDYPGYGKSGGSTTEAGCYAAADAAYDWLIEKQKIPADRLILYGGSLGGAVAVDLASRRVHRALLLVSTFTTFPDIAQKECPFLPARWLVRNHFDSLAKIKQVTGPVFVTHSTAGQLIPFSMGQQLFAAANEPKMFFAMQGLGHHDGGNRAAFEAFAAFLQQYAP